MHQYPARFEPEEGAYVVTFRDVPEAITQGASIEEARRAARDALATALEFYIEDGRAFPTSSAVADGEELITLPPEATERFRSAS